MYRITYTLQKMILMILLAPVVGRKDAGVKISLRLVNRGTDLGSIGQISKISPLKRILRDQPAELW